MIFYEKIIYTSIIKNGTFTEQIEGWASHISQSSMGADMADVNNDGKADIFNRYAPESDERLKNTTNFENYDLFLRKINLDFFNMQNTLQINNGNNLWKLLIMLVLLKQMELGLCCLTWIMMDIKISMFATEFTMI
jgi:hypothetical protein